MYLPSPERSKIYPYGKKAYSISGALFFNCHLSYLKKSRLSLVPETLLADDMFSAHSYIHCIRLLRFKFVSPVVYKRLNMFFGESLYCSDC